MSTTFGVKVNGKMVEIAHRACGWGINWTNELGPALNSSRKVYAIDNTPQGVETVGDIKRLTNTDYCRNIGEKK